METQISTFIKGQNYIGYCDSIDNNLCNLSAGNGTCLNGGVCVEIKSGIFECSCKNGFFGVYCESKAQTCSDVTCFNGGSCIEVYDSFQCHCTDGFTGTHCELSRCVPDVCQNGGVCLNINVFGSFLCRCREGYTGLFCEIIVTTSTSTSTSTTTTTTIQTTTRTTTTTTTRRPGVTTTTTAKFLFPIEISIKITNLIFISDYNNLSSLATISLQNEYFSLVSQYFKKEFPKPILLLKIDSKFNWK